LLHVGLVQSLRPSWSGAPAQVRPDGTASSESLTKPSERKWDTCFDPHDAGRAWFFDVTDDDLARAAKIEPAAK
jgi:hypothetical protein